MNEGGFIMYPSMTKNIRQLASIDKEAALEYVLALIDSAEEGIEYEGNNLAIKISMNTEMILLDRQKERRFNSTEGGKSGYKVSDSQIIEALIDNHFNTLFEAAVYINENYCGGEGYSYQALGKRLKKMGLTLDSFFSQP